MRPQVVSLRKQFLLRTLLIFVVIAAISGVLQVVLVKRQIMDNTEVQANLVANSIQQGIEETDLASKEIENQINLKLVSISRNVASELSSGKYDDISNESLAKIRDEFKLKGITLFANENGQVVGVRSTEAQEIGFSFNKYGDAAVKPFLEAFSDRLPHPPGRAYAEQGAFVLEISQSGSHADTPEFFKYAYYHHPGTNYIINIYITANEVYKFTEKEGPNVWIDKVKRTNPYVKEIAVLNPEVFENPELEKQIYEPQKKVAYGSYKIIDTNDTEIVKATANDHKPHSVVQTDNGKRLYRMFVPLSDTQVIYFSLDYDKMSAPVYRHSIILIVSGVLSMLLLSLIIFRFFNYIYDGIKSIKTQIMRLETGDFTAKSKVIRGGELTQLSESANVMVDKLRGVLVAASDNARKVQRTSLVLKTEAGESVEKVYLMSIETTANTRAAVEDISFYLDALERYLSEQKEDEKKSLLQNQLSTMREYVRTWNTDTTEMTITLSDLVKSLFSQSEELAEISDELLKEILKFNL